MCAFYFCSFYLVNILIHQLNTRRSARMVVYVKERCAGIWFFLSYYYYVGENGHQITMVIAFKRYIISYECYYFECTLLIRHFKGYIILIMAALILIRLTHQPPTNLQALGLRLEVIILIKALIGILPCRRNKKRNS